MSTLALPFSVPAEAATRTPFSLGHRSGIDGLRALAILLVLTVHLDRLHALPLTLGLGGFLGVDLFFVISGFLITSILVEEHSRDGNISLSRFYIRRALRLLPALLSLLILVGVAAVILNLTLGLTPVRVASTLGYFTNWIRAYESWDQVWIFAHFWSLSIEEQFYLIWPLAMVLLVRAGLSQKTLLTVALVGAATACALRLALFLNGTPTERLYHGTDTRADALLIGCALSLAAYSGINLTKAVEPLYRASVIIFVSAAVFTAQKTAVFYAGGFTLIALCCAVILFRTVENPQKAFLHPVLQWIGKRSYGLYLWHWPIYGLFKSLPVTLALPCAIAFTFAAAALSYRFIEEPFLRRKRRYNTV